MVSLSHKRAQKTVICPLCGAVSWKNGLLSLRFFPANKALLGDSRVIHLCSACLERFLVVSESERWLCYLELIYKRHIEQAMSVGGEGQKITKGKQGGL